MDKTLREFVWEAKQQSKLTNFMSMFHVQLQRARYLKKVHKKINTSDLLFMSD